MVNLNSISRVAYKLSEMSQRAYIVSTDLTQLPDSTQEDIAKILSEHNIRVWNSQGGEIGTSWNGRTLVKTGNLKDSVTNPDRIVLDLGGITITYSSSVPYAKWVNEKYTFIGSSQTLKEQLKQRLILYIRSGV